MTAVVLVFDQSPGEIILALVGNARDVVGAGEIRLVAAIAVILINDRLRALHPRGIAGIGRRRRLRKLADKIRKGAQIVVGKRLCHLVHRLERAQFFAKHEKLDQCVRRLLAAKRWRILGFGLSALTMTGKTRRGALFDRFCSY